MAAEASAAGAAEAKPFAVLFVCLGQSPDPSLCRPPSPRPRTCVRAKYSLRCKLSHPKNLGESKFFKFDQIYTARAPIKYELVRVPISGCPHVRADRTYPSLFRLIAFEYCWSLIAIIVSHDDETAFLGAHARLPACYHLRSQ